MQSLAEIEVMSNQGTNEYIVKQIEWTKYSLIILGVFAMLSIIFICTLWVEKRKREYLIYKAFGFDMVRIICMIFTETGRLVLLSFGLAWFFELICFLFSGNLQGLRMPFLFSCLAVVFIHVLTLALPLFKVWLAKPTQSGIDSIWFLYTYVLAEKIMLGHQRNKAFTVLHERIVTMNRKHIVWLVVLMLSLCIGGCKKKETILVADREKNEKQAFMYVNDDIICVKWDESFRNFICAENAEYFVRIFIFITINQYQRNSSMILRMKC